MKTSTRSRSSGLTREQIVDTALRQLERHPATGVSLRAIATELGVTPMALYRHVRNRDDLLVEVIDVLLAERGLPSGRLSWPRYLEAIAASLRAVLVEWPALTTVFNRRPVTTPAARARLAGAVDVLERAGFERRAAVRAYAAVHMYTVGFCVLEAGRAGFEPGAAASDDWEATAIERFVSPAQFQFGLRSLIAGFGSGLP